MTVRGCTSACTARTVARRSSGERVGDKDHRRRPTAHQIITQKGPPTRQFHMLQSSCKRAEAAPSPIFRCPSGIRLLRRRE